MWWLSKPQQVFGLSHNSPPPLSIPNYIGGSSYYRQISHSLIFPSKSRSSKRSFPVGSIWREVLNRENSSLRRICLSQLNLLLLITAVKSCLLNKVLISLFFWILHCQFSSTGPKVLLSILFSILYKAVSDYLARV